MNSFSRHVRTLTMSIPIAVFIQENVYGLYYVHEVRSSKVGNGDKDAGKEETTSRVVLVRKLEFGSVLESCFRALFSSSEDDSRQRARLRRYEQFQVTSVDSAWFFQTSPTVLTGDSVVCKRSDMFPESYSVREVVGVSGQWIKRNRTGSVRAVPVHTIACKGCKQSAKEEQEIEDISKSLSVGIACAVVWPPQHWKVITRQAEDDVAFWP